MWRSCGPLCESGGDRRQQDLLTECDAKKLVTPTVAGCMAFSTYRPMSFDINSISSSNRTLCSNLSTEVSECESLVVSSVDEHPLILLHSANSNVEENLILRDVFDKIGPGMRTDRPSYDELFDIVENGIRELIAWEKRWIDMMGAFYFHTQLQDPLLTFALVQSW